MKLTIVCFSAALLLASSAMAQQYPNLQSVQISARASYEGTSRILDFTYSVSNSASSAGSVISFEIAISKFDSQKILDTTGLRFKSQFVQDYFRSQYSTLANRIVPVGFPAAPGIWVGGLADNLTAAFWGDARQLIAPNQSLSGFVMSSKGLPAIRPFRASPRFDVASVFPNVDDSSTTMTSAEMDSIRRAADYSGLTIGPVAPPGTFNPLPFVDTISSDVTRARELNWVSTQSTADKYTGLLIRIRFDILQSSLKTARARIDSILTLVNADSSQNISPEAYALIRYNIEYLRDNLSPSMGVKAGVTFSTGSSLSVKALPSTQFGQTDTLRSIVETVRWPSVFSVSFGTVNSNYGFTAYEGITETGGYRYQKFRTTAPQALNWLSGTEYVLFTVPVTGMCGAEILSLSNSLFGGEWFVDINYLDKTDSVFYQPVAQGFAFQNKSSTNGATTYNGQRLAALHGTKFHEVYQSASEIIYRRKDLNSANWDTTLRISAGNGSNTVPSIAVAHDGSVHVVWERQLNSSAFALWYNRSTDGGLTWGTPYRLPGADSVLIVQQNQWEIYPQLAELGTSQLVAVVCSSSGPRYTTSTNLGANWSDLTTITGVQYPTNVWHPSLAPGSNFLLLTYDTRSYGVYSKKYNGTGWLTEQRASTGVGTIYDRYSSVFVDDVDVPHIVWCAQRSGRGEYSIIFKDGVSGGTGWSSQYTEFPYQSGISNLYPSASYQRKSGFPYGKIDVANMTTANQILLNQKDYMSGWGSQRSLSGTGQWASTSLIERGSSTNYDIWLWTDQSGSSPYEVKRSSDGGYQLQSIPSSPMTTELHRRVTIESPSNDSFVSFEVGPIKLVTASGDTTIVPFKGFDKSKPLLVSTDNAWDYLGTDSVALPSDVRYLVMSTDIQTVVREDSLGTKGKNVFSGQAFRVDLEGGKGTVSAYSDPRGASGTKVINIAPWAGQKAVIRPAGTTTVQAAQPVVVGVGDIYVKK